MKLSFLFPIGIGFFIYFLPHSSSIDPKGWTLLSVFVGTIVGSITKPLPMGPVALIGLLISILCGCLKIQEALSSCGSPLIWMIIFVFLIAKGFSVTPLGERIAYTFMQRFGRKTLGLGYGVALSELCVAPLVPSSGARCGGIIFPIVKSITQALGKTSNPHTEKEIGAFLTQVCLQANCITSAMFLTAMAANPFIQSIALKQGVSITWTKWAICACVPGLLSLAILPTLIYYLVSPKLCDFSESVTYAAKKLKEIGPVTRSEKIMISVFGIMLCLWITEGIVDPTTTALLGLVILLVTGVVQWKDLLAEYEAWHTLVWLSILITMSSCLQKYGVIQELSHTVGLIVPHNMWGIIVLILTYFYAHYMFASNTAHASAMYAAFLSIGIQIGAPPLLFALILGFCTSLFGGLTHYGCSPAPIVFGAQYISISRWWKTGFFVSIVNLIIWLGAGSLWWKALGLW